MISGMGAMTTIGIMVTTATAAITMITKNTVTGDVSRDGDGEWDNRGREKRVRWKTGPH